MKKPDNPIKLKPITAAWNPNMAFRLRTTAEHKRHVARFHRFRNWRERIGLPVQYHSDPLANQEILILRMQLYTSMQNLILMENA